MTSPPVRRVFLHVGSPKTGTTFLQNVLWAQRRRAADQGLLLPLERFHDHYLASLDLRGLSARPEHPERAQGIWDRLADEARAWRGGTVLVSHELFAAATREQASRAVASFGDAEVHVVLTARDLVRQITAEWQEHVKHRSTSTFPEFVDGLRRDTDRTQWFWKVQDFADVLQRWGADLPPERVHVVTVPQPGSPPELLWTRFAGLLGLDAGSFDLAVARSNESLGVAQAELLRRVNLQLGDRLPIPGPYPGVVKNVLAHQVLAARPGARITLSEADRGFALAESARVAEAIEHQGHDVVGDLAELVPASTEPGATSYPEPSSEELLTESVAALADVLVVLADRRAQRRYEALTRELRRQPVRFVLRRATERHPALARARAASARLRRGRGGERSA